MARLRFIALALCLMIAQAICAQQNTAVMELSPHDASTAQGMEGGTWRIDHNFTSVLHLTNILITSNLTVTPKIFFADGTEFALNPVTLDPGGTAEIDIGLSIKAAPSSIAIHKSDYGMAGVAYQ